MTPIDTSYLVSESMYGAVYTVRRDEKDTSWTSSVDGTTYEVVGTLSLDEENSYDRFDYYTFLTDGVLNLNDRLVHNGFELTVYKKAGKNKYILRRDLKTNESNTEGS